MRYGFKARAERISLEFRRQNGTSLVDPIEPISFLLEQEIIVWTPYDVPGLGQSALDQLISIDPDSWSGLTIREAGKTAVIINPIHPAGRQANTLMHEWAHLYLNHEPKRVDITPEGVLLISDYAREDEDEADWLAGSMLIPRDGLLSLYKRGFDAKLVAETYGVSIELAQWRIRMTGVTKQFKASARW